MSVDRKLIKCPSCGKHAIREWISVADSLPQKEGEYLTTSMYEEVNCDYWNGMYFNRTELVIAWMPLPEPYIKRGGIDE